ncbi:hypothetical protein KQX54_009863 [Cotesia glomerata]|uniref:Uncharacterized protein n=1 Tax=Cotesia glomerata TaxID=32391 RepID=A0AAV7IEG9_COTGL|nr:hypothetical protein KQX54_009863 [Cotesia glomerata]
MTRQGSAREFRGWNPAPSCGPSANSQQFDPVDDMNTRGSLLSVCWMVSFFASVSKHFERTFDHIATVDYGGSIFLTHTKKNANKKWIRKQKRLAISLTSARQAYWYQLPGSHVGLRFIR